MNNERRVLVVEDEVEIRRLISLHLKREGFTVVEAGDGQQAMEHLRDSVFHLVIMDWMLPERTGLELTRWIRGQTRFDRLPILFVTAKSEPEHIATGLDAGADDYLGKPFDTIVLMARVHALLRRNQWLNQEMKNRGEELKAGGLTLRPDSFESFLHGEKLVLTRSEFKLLETLLANQGKVLSREALIEQIQGEGVNVVGRTIDTHIFGLRKKLGDQSELIETIRGVGYRVRFAAEI